MRYLLDINIFSEMTRPRPDERVRQWFEQVPSTAIHASVLTVGEIRRGIAKMPGGPKQQTLQLWIDVELVAELGHRLLPISLAVAERWGRLLAEVGRSLPVVDSLIAATALHHDLKLVTRNRRDFAIPGLVVINPWD